MKYDNFLTNDLFQRPFKNTVYPDEDYASLICHIQAMEEYMIKVNTGQETPDNGRREIFDQHFAEVRRLTKPINLPVSIQYAMASVYQTHPAFAEARLLPPAPPPAPLPPVDMDLEVDLSSFKTVDELNEYVAALGDLAMVRGDQVQSVSEDDQKEIVQIIEILENEPDRLPPGHRIDEVKSYYQALIRMLEAHEYMKRVTVQLALGHQKRWKKNKMS
jgi:hypothetical protein